ncbi:MAG: hypothetical protein IKB88_11900 [Clostridia bacterium]|nr:hypothetical protein [Clostridia bacterium]
MKKIVYISDYALDEYNSVRDILYNIITLNNLQKYEHVVVKSTGNMHKPISKKIYDGFTVYSNTKLKTSDYIKAKNISLGCKISYIFHRIIKRISVINKNSRYKKYDNEAFLKRIIKEEKPQLIIFLTYSPKRTYVKMCQKYKTPYIFMLYDTYIERPGIDRAQAYETEKYVIDNSERYFIPSFFYEQYAKTYSGMKIAHYNLPLLINKSDVEKAFKEYNEQYNFTYFGQIQSFRKEGEIKRILRNLNIQLDVFSTENYKDDDVFKIHAAKTGHELYKKVAGSKYLVAFDNGYPYQNYLPSKVYLYTSFTKPVIAFGDNKESALIEFFKNYPMFYYQNINESTDGLVEFLKKEKTDRFAEDCYALFSEYLPEQALQTLTDSIKTVLNKQIEPIDNHI